MALISSAGPTRIGGSHEIAEAERIASKLVLERPGTDDLTLANGLAGQMILLCQLAKHSARADLFRDAASEVFVQIHESLTHAPFMRAGLFDGLAGIVWAATSAARELRIAQHPNTLSDVSDFYVDYLSRDFHYEFDLMSGLAGIGLWAATIEERRIACHLISRILSILESMAVHSPAGLAWETPPVRQHYVDPTLPRPEYNLGLAHGIPGVVVFLATCCASRLGGDTANTLLTGAAKWLRAQAVEHRPGGFYSTTVAHSDPARLAWCYGDPGVALSLLSASKALSQDQVRRFALTIIDRASTAASQQGRVVDSGLCHGSAGLALLFSYFSKHSRSRLPREACYRWWATLRNDKKRSNEEEFLFWNHHTKSYEANAGLLAGSAGVALALLTSATDDWSWALPFGL